MKIVVLFDNLGPYHIARLRGLSEVCELEVIEFGSESATYTWDAANELPFRSMQVNQSGSSEELSLSQMQQRISQALDDTVADVVAIPGWSSSGALSATRWCIEKRIPSVLMSESTYRDHRRSTFIEYPKQLLVTNHQAALVGGIRHREYVESLGLRTQQIFTGYNAVDNPYFEQSSQQHLKSSDEQRHNAPYFLCSNRFIPRKNLSRVIEAYSDYATQATGPLWDLCLLGDGPERASCERLADKLGMTVVKESPWTTPHSTGPNVDTPRVFFPGFRQVDELPKFYAFAGCFVHAALTEPWGLVVNEAMACGLPVIISSGCGCSPDLVKDGKNGLLFDPESTQGLRDAMCKIAQASLPERESMGTESRCVISNYGVEQFASGMLQAAHVALERGGRRRWSSKNALKACLALRKLQHTIRRR